MAVRTDLFLLELGSERLVDVTGEAKRILYEAVVVSERSAERIVRIVAEEDERRRKRRQQR